MDTLSTSVSSLSLPSLPPPPPQPQPQPQFHRRLGTTTTAAAASNLSKPASIISHKPASSSSSSSYPFTHKNPNFHRTVSFSSVKPLKSPRTHKNAASGYAAALTSICQSKNCLGRTQEDVARLLEILDRGCLVGEEKGEIVKEMVEKGKFGKYLKVLVKMLVERGRLGILGEVLEEFERIYDELVGAKVVWVSS